MHPAIQCIGRAWAADGSSRRSKSLLAAQRARPLLQDNVPSQSCHGPRRDCDRPGSTSLRARPRRREASFCASNWGQSLQQWPSAE
eukprot:445228-Pyramimonas_sp.AAC.2